MRPASDVAGPPAPTPEELAFLKRHSVGTTAAFAIMSLGSLGVTAFHAAFGAATFVIAFLGWALYAKKRRAAVRAASDRRVALHVPASYHAASHIAFLLWLMSMQLIANAVVMHSFSRAPRGPGLLFFTVMVVFFVGLSGVILAFHGRFTRVPGPRSCAKCLYPLGDADPRPIRCPECGTLLGPATAVTSMLPARHPGLLWSGVACLVAAGLAGGVLFTNPVSIYAVMPTSFLIGRATTDSSAMLAVTARSLSDSQRAKLADACLSARKQRVPVLSYRIDEGLEWIAGEIAAGRLTEAQRQRYYAEGLEFTLDAPATAKVGELILVGLWCNDLGHASRTASYYLFNGFLIDGNAEIVSNPNSPGRTGPPNTINGLTPPAEPDDRHSAAIRAGSPGPVTILCQVFVFAGPRTAPTPIAWPADAAATPQAPADAEWSELRTLEVTVDVTP